MGIDHDEERLRRLRLRSLTDTGLLTISVTIVPVVLVMTGISALRQGAWLSVTAVAAAFAGLAWLWALAWQGHKTRRPGEPLTLRWGIASAPALLVVAGIIAARPGIG